MKYSAQSLAKALLKLIQENPDNQQKIIASFVDFCDKKRLTHLFDSLLKYIEIEIKKEEDNKTLKIFSAGKLDEKIVEQIGKLSEAGPGAPISVIEEKDIVAGFIAYYQNKIIDASLDNNLRLLKNKLINA